MGKQRKVTKVEMCILKRWWMDRDFLSESKRIKVRVPEGVEVRSNAVIDKYFDIETY